MPGFAMNPEEWAIEKILRHSGNGSDSIFEILFKLGDTAWMPYTDVQHLQAVESYLEAIGADSIAKLPGPWGNHMTIPSLFWPPINRGRSENPGHTWMTPDPINDLSPASSKELDLDTETTLLSQLIIDDGLYMNENPVINLQLTMMENQGNSINALNNEGANVTLQTFTPGHFLHAGNVDKCYVEHRVYHATCAGAVTHGNPQNMFQPSMLNICMSIPTASWTSWRTIVISHNSGAKGSIGAMDTDTNLYDTTTAMGYHPHVTIPTLDMRSTIIMMIATSIEADQGLQDLTEANRGLPVGLGMVVEGTDTCPQDMYAGPGPQVISPRDCPSHTPLVNTTDVTTHLDMATEMASSTQTMIQCVLALGINKPV
ncbi:hypothetical protein K439DRAFT_1620540 [Ramaria rubella]|nr:hypothetical protein K439DRAFT_1620540 [Ramaria rubella]